MQTKLPLYVEAFRTYVVLLLFLGGALLLTLVITTSPKIFSDPASMAAAEGPSCGGWFGTRCTAGYAPKIGQPRSGARG